MRQGRREKREDGLCVEAGRRLPPQVTGHDQIGPQQPHQQHMVPQG